MKDSRAKALTERHGALVQVELDALDPADLRELFQAAIGSHGYWDTSRYEESSAPSTPAASGWGSSVPS